MKTLSSRGGVELTLSTLPAFEGMQTPPRHRGDRLSRSPSTSDRSWSTRQIDHDLHIDRHVDPNLPL